MNKRQSIVLATMWIGLSSSFVLAGDPQRLVASGDAVPGQAATFTSVNLAGVDGAGAAIIGSYSLGADNFSGLFNYKNGVTTPMVDSSTVGPDGETIQSIIGTGDYENGVIVFAANTTLGQSLYRFTPGGSLALLVRAGDVLPGAGGVAIGNFLDGGVGGDASEYAFSNVRNDNSAAVYVSVAGSGMQAVDDKTRSGVAELGNFIDFPSIHYRNGQTAFIGTGLDPDDPEAEPEPAGVFIARPGNPFEIVAGKNQPIPNAHDADERFTDFDHPRILADGRVAFSGGFVDEGDDDKIQKNFRGKDEFPDHHIGVFVRNADQSWKIYADTDMDLPGLHAPIGDFDGYSIESGINFFGAEDETGGTYIYYESADGIFTHLIDSYSMLDGKDVLGIHLLGDTALDGLVYFRADFEDGTSGVYAIDVPEPASIGLIAGAMGALSLRRRRR